MNCKQAITYIHHSLDGELQRQVMLQLNDHLDCCEACYRHLKRLEQTEAFLRMRPRTETIPAGLTERVIGSIPKTSKRRSSLKWVKRHPAIAAASLFVFFMLGSLLTTWDEGNELIVKGNELHRVVIEGNTVTVPKGSTLHSDLFVEHGVLQIDGQVEGNLVVIDGKLNLASTAYISGEIKQVDRMLDWFWYKIGEVVSTLGR